MTAKEFDAIVEDQLNHCLAMLGAKSKEYADPEAAMEGIEGDRLYNFKRAAELLGNGNTPMDALLGMWSKHMVSVMDILDTISCGGMCPSDATLDEKFTDFINYALLAKALAKEMAW